MTGHQETVFWIQQDSCTNDLTAVETAHTRLGQLKSNKIPAWSAVVVGAKSHPLAKDPLEAESFWERQTFSLMVWPSLWWIEHPLERGPHIQEDVNYKLY